MKKFLLILFCLLLPSTALAADNSRLSLFAAATNIKEILAAFTADTGIETDYLEMSTGEVLTRLRASRGKAQADAWYGGAGQLYCRCGRGHAGGLSIPPARRYPSALP